MKFNESWLREWVNPAISTEELAKQLTSVGLELEAMEPVEGKNDTNFDVAISPNRGDCLSLYGVAREIGVKNQIDLTPVAFTAVPASIEDTFPVEIADKKNCPHYVGRVIKGVKANVATPEWMQSRLEACGVNAISPVVDVTNYVMLELGQPMHAFDLAKLEGGIVVRQSQPDEPLTLLDDTELELEKTALVIADAKQPLALAGVMGGLSSSVTDETQDIFLEAAYFDPISVRLTSRHYGVISDSSYRFERGVDPSLQIRAVERATELLLDIVGGQAGPIIEEGNAAISHVMQAITLRRNRVERLLGVSIADDMIESILSRLDIELEKTSEGWLATPPAFRFDLEIEADLIEEIARVYGLDNIPTIAPKVAMQYEPEITPVRAIERLKQSLVEHGYFETISYSFTDEDILKLFEPKKETLSLLNPISPELSVMRTSLWPSLVKTLLHNSRRQQSRVRLFETGSIYYRDEQKNIVQTRQIAGIVTGSVCQEQWGQQSSPVDFFDIKADVQSLIASSPLGRCDITFEPAEHAALHPGRCMAVKIGEQEVGLVGALHPQIVKTLDLPADTYVFQLALEPLYQKALPQHQGLSKFPTVRRDIALLVDKTVSVAKLKAGIVEGTSDLLKDMIIFDVYQGDKIAADKKSVAIGLVFQHNSRTLTDDEIVQETENVLTKLSNDFQAIIRE